MLMLCGFVRTNLSFRKRCHVLVVSHSSLLLYAVLFSCVVSHSSLLLYAVLFSDADEAERLKCSSNNAVDLSTLAWNCSLWESLGNDFAYIHTGAREWVRNGTTLSISKKGSGLPTILNPCIDMFLRTESYYNLCVEYGLESSCFPNSYFPTDTEERQTPWSLPTSELETSCDRGYCACPR